MNWIVTTAMMITHSIDRKQKQRQFFNMRIEQMWWVEMRWEPTRTNIRTLRLSERRLEINLWFGVPTAHNMLKRGIGPTFRESRFFAQTTTHQSPNLCASKFEYIPLNDTQKGSRLTHPWKIGSTFIVPMARCVRLNEMNF